MRSSSAKEVTSLSTYGSCRTKNRHKTFSRLARNKNNSIKDRLTRRDNVIIMFPHLLKQLLPQNSG